MLRTTITAIIALALLAPVSAIVNYTGPTDQVHIMGGGDQNDSQIRPVRVTAGDASVVVTKTASECAGPGNTSVAHHVDEHNASYRVFVQGVVEAPNPCVGINASLTRNGSSYVLDVRTTPSGMPCMQCLGHVSYEANASFSEATELVVKHDGTTQRTIRVGETDSLETRRGFFSRIVSFLASLFS